MYVEGHYTLANELEGFGYAIATPHRIASIFCPIGQFGGLLDMQLLP